METMKHLRPLTRRASLLAAGVAIAAGSLLISTTAYAVPVLTTSGNATLTKGSSRAWGAVWGQEAPYRVDFNCGLSGCANYTTSSTTTTELARTVYYGGCGGGNFQAVHRISVWTAQGTRLDGSSSTTWTGNLC